MTKDKIGKLTIYLVGLQARLLDPVPKKHENHPETYKNFLEREIRVVSKQLEEARLEDAK